MHSASNENPKLRLREYSEEVLPFVGVEGRFAVENPFTGNHTGFLRVRICVGTAEQLVALATTIKAIIKLQSVVRGVLYRKRFKQLDDNAPVSLHLQTDPERTNIFVQTDDSFETKSVVDVGCDAMEDNAMSK
ncbi:Hypothetical protein PHPALM_6398 [Phytophthora palmivora]|uniref:Uncharacterized protein n=1 Tax=Phytophthora palmivora TaxID=4796 RepID=A0A2P4YEW8_9STRA|nr:Hypothetical protein PHPALM_6398 [Phytophthora palmivora]